MKPNRKRTIRAAVLLALGSLLAAGPFLSWETYCTARGCFIMSREAFVRDTAHGSLSTLLGATLALFGPIQFLNRKDCRLGRVEGQN